MKNEECFILNKQGNLMKRFKRFENISDKENDLIEIEYGFAQKSTTNLTYKVRKIESKEEMKKRGIKSPDKADALALTMASSAVSFGGSQSFMGYNFRKPLKSRIIRVG